MPALKTLTSLNKEVRPFFPRRQSHLAFPSASSLSDYSTWRSWGLFYPCDHSIWSIRVHCLQILLSLRKNGKDESRLLNLRRLRSSRFAWVTPAIFAVLVVFEGLRSEALVFSGKNAHSSFSPFSSNQPLFGRGQPWIGDENWTQTFFLKLSGRFWDIPAKFRDIPPQKFDSLGFEGHTELFGPHPFTWKTPTPPENIRTQKFRFGFFFRAWLKTLSTLIKEIKVLLLN